MIPPHITILWKKCVYIPAECNAKSLNHEIRLGLSIGNAILTVIFGLNMLLKFDLVFFET